MSTVDEWAKREAEMQFATGPWVYPREAKGAIWMAERMAALLLSDEACEAATDQIERNGYDLPRREFRLAVEAALTKITEDN